MLSLDYFLLIVQASLVLNYGEWIMLELVIYVQLGVKQFDVSGPYHTMHTVVFYRCYVIVYLSMINFVNVF